MDVLNEVENGNRKMLCYPVMSVELHMPYSWETNTQG